jgi:hypothetical protein
MLALTRTVVAILLLILFAGVWDRLTRPANPANIGWKVERTNGPEPTPDQIEKCDVLKGVKWCLLK